MSYEYMCLPLICVIVYHFSTVRLTSHELNSIVIDLDTHPHCMNDLCYASTDFPPTVTNMYQESYRGKKGLRASMTTQRSLFYVQ
jgi:hypothetical protein